MYEFDVLIIETNIRFKIYFRHDYSVLYYLPINYYCKQ